MRKNNPSFTYEPEDEVLNIWLSKKPIDYAQQSGDIIVHFTEDGEAVYLEILDASHFLKQAATKLPKKVLETIMFPTYPSIAHKISK